MHVYLLSFFIRSVKPDKVTNAGNLAKDYVRRGPGPKEWNTLNKDLLRVYGKDLRILTGCGGEWTYNDVTDVTNEKLWKWSW